MDELFMVLVRAESAEEASRRTEAAVRNFKEELPPWDRFEHFMLASTKGPRNCADAPERFERTIRRREKLTGETISCLLDRAEGSCVDLLGQGREAVAGQLSHLAASCEGGDRCGKARGTWAAAYYLDLALDIALGRPTTWTRFFNAETGSTLVAPSTYKKLQEEPHAWWLTAYEAL